MTAPYYQDDLVTLYHGDCLEHPEWWTGADVLVTDPPYGIGYKVGRMNGTTKTARLRSEHWMRDQGMRFVSNDSDTTARDDALKLWGERPAISFGHWRRPRPYRTVMRLLWVKTAPGTLMADAKRAPWITQDEEIYVLANSASEFAGDRVDSNVFVDPTQCLRLPSQRLGHPTAKPDGLMQWLLKKCKAEWTIADPFAGSGSTLVAAKLLGRKAVGVELEERYCEVAARRLSQGVLEFDHIGTEEP